MKGFLKLKTAGKLLDQGSQKFLQRNFYLVLLLILILLFSADFKVRDSLKAGGVLGVASSESSQYPILNKTFVPQITAKGAVVMDADSKVILYSKNSDLRFSSASTTKIMTALTALDYFKPGDILTVKNTINEGVILGLKTGQKISFESLLYGLLLSSANDTAFTIAQNYASEKEFISKMNEKARRLNLIGTYYEDPAGLEDDGDYTTPFDLARLAAIAIKNETFAKIVGTREKTIVDYEGNEYSLKNLNKLLGEDVTGIKTGTTTGAGQVLVISKKEGDHTIIIVVMGSSDRFLDTKILINMVSGNISYLPIRL